MTLDCYLRRLTASKFLLKHPSFGCAHLEVKHHAHRLSQCCSFGDDSGCADTSCVAVAVDFVAAVVAAVVASCYRAELVQGSADADYSGLRLGHMAAYQFDLPYFDEAAAAAVDLEAVGSPHGAGYFGACFASAAAVESA